MRWNKAEVWRRAWQDERSSSLRKISSTLKHGTQIVKEANHGWIRRRRREKIWRNGREWSRPRRQNPLKHVLLRSLHYPITHNLYPFHSVYDIHIPMTHHRFLPHRRQGLLHGGVTRRRWHHSAAAVKRVVVNDAGKRVGVGVGGGRSGAGEALNEVHEVTWCGVDNLGGNRVDYYGLARWWLGVWRLWWQGWFLDFMRVFVYSERCGAWTLELQFSPGRSFRGNVWELIHVVVRGGERCEWWECCWGVVKHSCVVILIWGWNIRAHIKRSGQWWRGIILMRDYRLLVKFGLLWGNF